LTAIKSTFHPVGDQIPDVTPGIIADVGFESGLGQGLASHRRQPFGGLSLLR
jgi:hypothetical protein